MVDIFKYFLLLSFNLNVILIYLMCCFNIANTITKQLTKKAIFQQILLIEFGPKEIVR